MTQDQRRKDWWAGYHYALHLQQLQLNLLKEPSESMMVTQVDYSLGKPDDPPTGKPS